VDPKIATFDYEIATFVGKCSIVSSNVGIATTSAVALTRSSCAPPPSRWPCTLWACWPCTLCACWPCTLWAWWPCTLWACWRGLAVFLWRFLTHRVTVVQNLSVWIPERIQFCVRLGQDEARHGTPKACHTQGMSHPGHTGHTQPQGKACHTQGMSRPRHQSSVTARTTHTARQPKC